MANKKFSRKCWQGIGVAFIVLVMAPAAFGATIYWTNWTLAGPGHLEGVASPPGSAAGTITGATTLPVTVGYSGELTFGQTSGGINYWDPSTPYISPSVLNAPPDSDIIALDLASTGNTITFSQALVNPIMAIVSLGRSGEFVSYTFAQPFDVLSDGPGYWGGPGTLTELAGNVLQGDEGHGVIQFNGTYSSISWSSDPSEYWHGFTVGVAAVPEAGALMLFGTGLIGLVGYRRVRRMK